MAYHDSLSPYVSHSVWGLPLVEYANASAWRAASREGQFSTTNSGRQRNYDAERQKRKFIICIFDRKKNNTAPRLLGQYGVVMSRIVDPWRSSRSRVSSSASPHPHNDPNHVN